jgi:hypothetical protein
LHQKLYLQTHVSSNIISAHDEVAAALIYCSARLANSSGVYRDHQTSSVAPPETVLILYANRTTVVPFAYNEIPLGSIKPNGWLLQEMQTEANGLAGHLHDFWKFVNDSSWLGGKTEYSGLNEAFPYWLNGLVPLAYTLDDARLKEQVHSSMEYLMVCQSRYVCISTFHPLMPPAETHGQRRRLDRSRRGWSRWWSPSNLGSQSDLLRVDELGRRQQNMGTTNRERHAQVQQTASFGESVILPRLSFPLR